jgi:predicted DsbA family dithiol-disulfide isomerase
MKIEVWSDVMCPWCYIGKRRLETALASFDHAQEVEVIWKSFQLNPDMKTDPSKSINQYLVEAKGWTLDYARQVSENVTNIAAKEGLEYHLDQSVVANSYAAHRVLQMAKAQGLGDALKERLLHAYFTEGKNIGDHKVLIELAGDAGLDRKAVQQMLYTNEYCDEVDHDVEEARELGARGVPFFVIDRKYGISGAQPVEVFTDVLNQVWTETHTAVADGDVCLPGEDC